MVPKTKIVPKKFSQLPSFDSGFFDEFAYTRPPKQLKGHSSFVTSVSVSSDGSTVISASADATCRIWSTDTGIPTLILEGHTGPVTSICLSADNNTILSCGEDKTCRVWYASTGENVRTICGHPENISSVALSSDGSLVVTGSWDNTCRVWTYETGELRSILEGHSGWVRAVAISPDNRYIVSCSQDTTCILWDAESGELVHTFEMHTGYVAAVNFSHNSIYVGSGGKDEQCILWNASTRSVLNTLVGHTDVVTGVTFSSDDSLAVTCSADTTCRVWEVSSGRMRHVLKGHTSVVTSVAVNGTTLVSGSNDFTCRLWNISSGKFIKELMAYEEDEEEVVESVQDRVQRARKEPVRIIPVELNKSFTFFQKASLYEVQNMISRLLAMEENLPNVSLYERKQFIGIVSSFSDVMTQKLIHVLKTETISTAMLFTKYVLHYIQDIASRYEDAISPKTDTAIAKILKEALKENMLQDIDDVRDFVARIATTRLVRTNKCFVRMEEELKARQSDALRNIALEEPESLPVVPIEKSVSRQISRSSTLDSFKNLLPALFPSRQSSNIDKGQ